MRKLITLIGLLAPLTALDAAELKPGDKFNIACADVVIYSATPAGIAAAIADDIQLRAQVSEGPSKVEIGVKP